MSPIPWAKQRINQELLEGELAAESKLQHLLYSIRLHGPDRFYGDLALKNTSHDIGAIPIDLDNRVKLVVAK